MKDFVYVVWIPEAILGVYRSFNDSIIAENDFKSIYKNVHRDKMSVFS